MVTFFLHHTIGFVWGNNCKFFGVSVIGVSHDANRDADETFLL